MAHEASPPNRELLLTSAAEYLESVAGTCSSDGAPAMHTGTNAKSADQPSAYHKVQGDSVAKRSSGAWGSRGTSAMHRLDRPS
jgi:hypothetical protein